MLSSARCVRSHTTFAHRCCVGILRNQIRVLGVRAMHTHNRPHNPNAADRHSQPLQGTIEQQIEELQVRCTMGRRTLRRQAWQQLVALSLPRLIAMRDYSSAANLINTGCHIETGALTTTTTATTSSSKSPTPSNTNASTGTTSNPPTHTIVTGDLGHNSEHHGNENNSNSNNKVTGNEHVFNSVGDVRSAFSGWEVPGSVIESLRLCCAHLPSLCETDPLSALVLLKAMLCTGVTVQPEICHEIIRRCLESNAFDEVCTLFNQITNCTQNHNTEDCQQSKPKLFDVFSPALLNELVFQICQTDSPTTALRPTSSHLDTCKRIIFSLLPGTNTQTTAHTTTSTTTPTEAFLPAHEVTSENRTSTERNGDCQTKSLLCCDSRGVCALAFSMSGWTHIRQAGDFLKTVETLDSNCEQPGYCRHSIGVLAPQSQASPPIAEPVKKQAPKLQKPKFVQSTTLPRLELPLLPPVKQRKSSKLREHPQPQTKSVQKGSLLTTNEPAIPVSLASVFAPIQTLHLKPEVSDQLNNLVNSGELEKAFELCAENSEKQPMLEHLLSCTLGKNDMKASLLVFQQLFIAGITVKTKDLLELMICCQKNNRSKYALWLFQNSTVFAPGSIDFRVTLQALDVCAELRMAEAALWAFDWFLEARRSALTFGSHSILKLFQCVCQTCEGLLPEEMAETVMTCFQDTAARFPVAHDALIQELILFFAKNRATTEMINAYAHCMYAQVIPPRQIFAVMISECLSATRADWAHILLLRLHQYHGLQSSESTLCFRVINQLCNFGWGGCAHEVAMLAFGANCCRHSTFSSSIVALLNKNEIVAAESLARAALSHGLKVTSQSIELLSRCAAVGGHTWALQSALVMKPDLLLNKSLVMSLLTLSARECRLQTCEWVLKQTRIANPEDVTASQFNMCFRFLGPLPPNDMESSMKRFFELMNQFGIAPTHKTIPAVVHALKSIPGQQKSPFELHEYVEKLMGECFHPALLTKTTRDEQAPSEQALLQTEFPGRDDENQAVEPTQLDALFVNDGQPHDAILMDTTLGHYDTS